MERAISPHVHPTTTQAMDLFPKKDNPPLRESSRHAGSKGKEEATEPRSAPGNAHLKSSVREKLKDAIDNARLYSGSDDSDDEVPIASQLQLKKADVRHKAKLGDRHMVPRGEFCSTGRLDVLMLGVVSKHSTRGHTCTWFEGDERATKHKGRLEEWTSIL
jgi:hypothetical protein